jgi:hypothetical protein
MKLTVAHQILIASAIGLCAIFGLRCMVVGARDGNTGTLLLGFVSFAVLAGLAFYLRKFRRSLAEKNKRA